MIAALVVLLFVAAPSAGPPGWLLYWLGTDGSEAYLSVTEGHVIRGVRVLVNTQVEYPDGRYAVVGEVFDCSTHQYSILGRTDFDKDDKQIREYSNDDVVGSFRPPAPRDRQSVVMNGVCGGSLSTRPIAAPDVLRYFQEFDREVRRIRDRR